MSTPHISRDFNGRLTFDTDRVTSSDFPAVCRAVVDKFNLTAGSELVVGIDQMFWDFRCDGHVVELAWDIWMGLIVTAMSPEAEPLVWAIANWVCSKGIPGTSHTPPESDDHLPST